MAIKKCCWKIDGPGKKIRILIEANASKYKGVIIMYRLFSIIVFAIMTSGFLVTPAVSADDMSCWLEATDSEIYLTVWDLDGEGSELVKIWEGLLAPGNKHKLVTSNGKIRYYTNISSESSSAGVDKICRNANSISLP